MIERDLIFDIGMHRGEDTDFYIRKGYRVVGVEADPDNAEFCRQRFASQISKGQVKVVEGALAPSGTLTRIKFFKNIDLDFWGTVEPSFVERNLRLGTTVREIEVNAIDLIAIIKDVGTPWYLKSDIQGSDWIVLRALEMMADCPPLLSINAEKVSFDRLIAEVETLARLGYEKFQPVQQQSIPGSFIEASTLEGKQFAYRFEDGASGPFGDDLSNKWCDRERLLQQYVRIFQQYRLFGDNSMAVKFGGRRLLRLLGRLLGRPIPGWYDIHARVT